MDKNNLPVLYSCLLCSIVFASLFLPFMIAFLITFNQNNSKNRQTANAKKLTGAEDRNPTITTHTLTSVWPSCFLRSHICCTDYWQLNGIHVTVCLGLNFRTCPDLTFRKKRRKNKILRLTCGKCSLKKKNSNRINICLLNIEAEYEYCIVHFMNGLLNQQTKSFFL